MSDAHFRIEGRAARITIDRPKALNAITHEICQRVHAALPGWADDPTVDLVLIDAVGDKAFCAGGDLQVMYEFGLRGDDTPARAFWRDEYAMNAALASFAKPVVAFLQGYTMGGGVGLGCHASHRIVGDSSRIAMPECSIGLVPDVGGSLLLANAPGHLGEYLALTSTRMGPGDAIHAGFADHYLPEGAWDALKANLVETGNVAAIDRGRRPAPASPMAEAAQEIDTLFAGPSLGAIIDSLAKSDTEFAKDSQSRLSRNAPLAMAVALAIVRANRAPGTTVADALTREFRYTARSVAQGDFLEGIRATIIDKDRSPRWAHRLEALPEADVAAMTAPLGDEDLQLETTA